MRDKRGNKQTSRGNSSNGCVGAGRGGERVKQAGPSPRVKVSRDAVVAWRAREPAKLRGFESGKSMVVT